MKKKILIIMGIILALIIILYFPIPIGEDIKVYTKITMPARKNGNVYLPEGDLAPENYIITKEGIVYITDSSFENRELKKILNIFEKINLQLNKSNEDYICRLLNIYKTKYMAVKVY